MRFKNSSQRKAVMARLKGMNRLAPNILTFAEKKKFAICEVCGKKYNTASETGDIAVSSVRICPKCWNKKDY